MLTSADVSSYRYCIFIAKFRRSRAAQVCKHILNSRCCPSKCLLVVLAMFYFAVKNVKCSATVPPFCSYCQNNSISSPGFLCQRFNNLQKAALLTSFWRHRFNVTKFFSSSNWLWWIMRVILTNQKRGDIFKRIIMFVIQSPPHPGLGCHTCLWILSCQTFLSLFPPLCFVV